MQLFCRRICFNYFGYRLKTDECGNHLWNADATPLIKHAEVRRARPVADKHRPVVVSTRHQFPFSHADWHNDRGRTWLE